MRRAWWLLALIVVGCGGSVDHAPSIQRERLGLFGTVASPVVGDVFNASGGQWSNSPTSFSYQWEDCDSGGLNCSNIAGATSSSYTVAVGDEGHTIRVVVTAVGPSRSVTLTSAPSGMVASPGPAPVNTTAPYFCGVNTGVSSNGGLTGGCSSVTGSAVTGQTLTVGTGAWSNSPTSFSYQWQDCTTTAGQPPTTASCSNISGATSSSYTIVSGDSGHAIVPIVTATNAGGSTSTTVAGSCNVGSTVVGSPTVAAGCSPISAVAASTASGEEFCTNAPVTCGLPDPLSGNVGVPPGTSLTSVGSISCTNTTVNAKSTTGSVTVGNNCILENSKVTGSNNSGGIITISSGVTSVQFINDDISGTYSGSQTAPTCATSDSYSNSTGNLSDVQAEGSATAVTLNGVYLHCAAESFNGNAQIENSYLLSNEAWTGGSGVTHNECAYIAGGGSGGTLVSNSVCLNPQDNTAGLFGDDHAFGPLTNISVTGSLFATSSTATNGDLPLGCSNHTTDTASVTSNRFSAIYESTVLPGNTYPAGTTWTGNINDGTLATISEPGTSC